jgi:crotonobetainyl-CoA:carnitine CoA-transferase CaiB-like acyl-CoA transferase
MHGGEGQHIEGDLLSSLLASLVNQGTAYTIAGVVPARMGNAHPSIAPYELLATASGGLVLAVGTDRQFATLCRILGEERLATEGRFRTNSDRVAHRAQLRSELEGLLLRGTAQDWARKLTAAGVPAGLVNDIPAAFALAESLGLEPIVSIPRASGSPARLTRNPIRLSQTPARYDLPPPRLPRGESCHSRA